MSTIKCDECGATLIETESESRVKIGIEIQQAGFIYKNACLFSDKYTSLYFCNDKCSKDFYAVNIPKTDKNIRTQKALEELKKDIPKLAKECSDRIGKFADLLNRKITKQNESNF